MLEVISSYWEFIILLLFFNKWYFIFIWMAKKICFIVFNKDDF